MTQILSRMSRSLINTRIKEHLDFYKKNYCNKWVGIFLQGSQNYNLDGPNSDVDTKIIVLPSFEELIFNHKPISRTLVLPNNEHCDVKDIRLMFDCFRKQNVNFLEILFTKYKVMNPQFEDLFQPMFDSRELIAHYNNYAGINCMAGMIKEKHRNMFHPTPATQAVIDKYGYNGKDLCHMWRISDFMQRMFIEGESFEKCLKPRDAKRHNEYLLAKESGYVLAWAKELADVLDRDAVKNRERYMQWRDNVVCEDAKVVMDSVLLSIMQRALGISGCER